MLPNCCSVNISMKCKRGSHFIHLIKANADKLELRRANALPSSTPSSLAGVTFLPRRFRYSHRARVVVSISLCLMCGGAQRGDNRWLPHGPVAPSPRKLLSYQLQKRTVCECVKTNLLSGDWSNHKTTKLYLKKTKKSSIKKLIWKNNLGSDSGGNSKTTRLTLSQVWIDF